MDLFVFFRLTEALIVGVATTLVAFLSPLFLGQCKNMVTVVFISPSCVSINFLGKSVYTHA